MCVFSKIDTGQLPPRDRFPSWLDAVGRTIIPLDASSTSDTDFYAVMRAADLGVIRVVAHRYPPIELHRTPRLIRESDTDLLNVVLNLRGEATVAQGERTVCLGPHEFALLDCSRPFHAVHGAGVDQPAAVTLLVPRTMVSIPASGIARLVGARLSGTDAVGAVLCGYLREMIRHLDAYRSADVPRLGTVTLDLVVAMLAHCLDVEAAVPRPAHERALLVRVRAYIDAHLCDPALSPQLVAAAHHISTRTLHRLFHDHGATVASWIRTRRLERCRRDLADRRLETRSIHSVAAAWGFCDEAHFSRVFRARYGVSPRSFRRHQLAAPGRV